MTTDYIKTVQTRLTRKGIRLSKSQIREIYNNVVVASLAPTEDELNVVMVQLESQYQAPCHEANSSDLEIAKPQITEITPETNPDVWETLQPPTAQPTPTHQEESSQMTPAQAPAQPSNSSLSTSNHSALSKPSENNLAITQQQIQEAVEQQFGKENVETKTAILNHIAGDTFTTAQELQIALSKLRQMRLDVLMKLIKDHNQASASDENLLKQALQSATASRQQESEDFFGSFESQLQQMRAAFGL